MAWPSALVIQSPSLPDLLCWNTAVIIFAEDTECLLVAGLQVKVLRSVLHDGTKNLPILSYWLAEDNNVKCETWKSMLPLSLSILLMMSVTSTSVGLWPALLSQSWTTLLEFCGDILLFIFRNIVKLKKCSTEVLMAACSNSMDYEGYHISQC